MSVQPHESVSSRTTRRWNRFAFRLWGPASLGDQSTPVPAYDPDPPCPHCGHLESTHESFMTSDRKVLRRCPSAD